MEIKAEQQAADMKWTTEQQQVIDIRNRNILVSAAAGSGKTAVLVERIIQKITAKENPVDIDRLLVVTFTKAAAAEMRERIGAAIEKKLEENPEDENLKKQQTLLHNAQITTIDSFCLFVVRNYFEEIDLEPNFRIADQGEIKLLEMDVLNNVFEAEYAKAEQAKMLYDDKIQKQSPQTESDADGLEDFLHLVDAYSGKRSNQAVKDMVLKIYHQSASNPWPKEWISGLSKPYEAESEEELLETDLMRGICDYVKVMLLELKSKLESLRELALLPDGPTKYAETLDKDLALFAEADTLETFPQLQAFFAAIKFSTLGAIRKFTGDIQKKEAVSGGRDEVKKEIKNITNRYFSMSLEELVNQLKGMKQTGCELVRLSLLFYEAMEQEKQKKHIMDFSDVEHAALRIFVDEKTKELRSVAEEFQLQFEEIMIDEYQDSNQVQEEIMCAISNGRNMFMVGDVKQSIYRFRLARPELFMEKYHRFTLTESENMRIDLHKNFRSRQEVVDFSNDMFYKIMQTDLGNVAYDEAAALYCGASYQETPNMQAEVLFFDMEETEDELDDLGNRQLEARMVASKIKQLKEQLLITDKATRELRPLRYSDIVILFRSLKNWGNDFAGILESCGIPAHVATSTGYFSATEVQTVLALLQILDNPYQDIPMAAVLKSPIVGLDEEELAEIAVFEHNYDKEHIPGFAKAAYKMMEQAKEGKLHTFYQMYCAIREKTKDTPIHELIEYALELTGYGSFVRALPAGAQRAANLNMLLEKAIAYEKTSYKGLFHFVRYIEQLQKYDVDFGEADVTGENEDVVRIMTIHKSKGLEFPVVFVSGISKQFNEMDIRDKVVVHPDMGLGIDEMRTNPRVKRTCLIKTEIADRIRRDNLGEEMRVLYVALTRAKEKLILTGTVKKKDSLYEKNKGMAKKGVPITLAQRIKAKSYTNWIVPAVLSYPDKYDFTFADAAMLVAEEVKEAAEKEVSKAMLLEKIKEADKAIVQEFEAKFAYEYPYKQEMNKKSKYSVSELKRASMVETYDQNEGMATVPEFLVQEREMYIPEFARKGAIEGFSVNQEKNITEHMTDKLSGSNQGALRGTATHRVMQCLDFAGFAKITHRNYAQIKAFVFAELARIKEQKRITSEMAELVNPFSIIRFLQTDTAFRMAEAAKRGDLFIEKPFVMDYEGVLVQGIIDAFWIEENAIVLLDYKTDYVSAAEELISRYKMQLDLYADALCRVFSTEEAPVAKAESLIYSFRLQEVIRVV
uniref:helicase-exonuclease AddAB subunit AddA n=1 Tax=Agathobacter sp. TaxID=2021311 RepID=UPI004057C93F